MDPEVKKKKKKKTTKENPVKSWKGYALADSDGQEKDIFRKTVVNGKRQRKLANTFK